MNNDAAFFALEAAIPPELAARFKAHEAKIRAAVFRVPVAKVSPLLEQKQVYFVRKALARWDKHMGTLYREHDLREFGPDAAEDVAAAIFENAEESKRLLALGVDWIRAAGILTTLLKDPTQQEEPKGTVLWTTAPAAYDFASTWRSNDKATVFGSSYTRVVIRDTPQGAHEVQHQLNRYASGGQGTMTDAEMQKELEIEARKAKLEPHRAEFQEMRADVQTAARLLYVTWDHYNHSWQHGPLVREVYDPKIGRNTYVPDETPPDLPRAVSLLEALRARYKRVGTTAQREFDPAGTLDRDIRELSRVATRKIQQEKDAVAEKKKSDAVEARMQRDRVAWAESVGLRLGVYLVEDYTVLGRVTAWPFTNDTIQTDMGAFAIYTPRRRPFSGKDFGFEIPPAVLKHRPSVNILKVSWNGQTFFVWSSYGKDYVVSESGRRVPDNSETALAIYTSARNGQDEALDAAVTKLLQTSNLKSWTPFEVADGDEVLRLEAIAPARRGKDLVGFQVRGKGMVYQRMAKPKNGFLWVRQQ